jgi:hypothetical protein
VELGFLVHAFRAPPQVLAGGHPKDWRAPSQGLECDAFVAVPGRPSQGLAGDAAGDAFGAAAFLVPRARLLPFTCHQRWSANCRVRLLARHRRCKKKTLGLSLRPNARVHLRNDPLRNVTLRNGVVKLQCSCAYFKRAFKNWFRARTVRKAPQNSMRSRQTPAQARLCTRRALRRLTQRWGRAHKFRAFTSGGALPQACNESLSTQKGLRTHVHAYCIRAVLLSPPWVMYT